MERLSQKNGILMPPSNPYYWAPFILKGRNWARITVLVLFLIGSPVSVLFYIVEFRRDTLLGSLRIIIFIMQVVSLCLFFTKSSNAWFNAHKAASQVE
jgi:hypothetical protein